MARYKRRTRRTMAITIQDGGVIVDFGAKTPESGARLMSRLRIPRDDEGLYYLRADAFDGTAEDAAAEIYRDAMFIPDIAPFAPFNIVEKAENGDFDRCCQQSRCTFYDCADLAICGADETPADGFKTALFPHQVAAVRFAMARKVSALFMEMGTGKTRVALEVFARLRREQAVTQCLWLCPCSTIRNVRTQFTEHAPDDLVKSIMTVGLESLSSSERTRNDAERFCRRGATFLVIDESILIKNYHALRTQAVLDLASYCEYRVLLNGTPITRDAADLFGQFYVLDWRILGFRDAETYERRHVYRPSGAGGRAVVLRAEELLDKAARFSFSLRKSECLDLPEKTYHKVAYDMPREQVSEYARVAALYMNKLTDETSVFVALNALQQVTSGKTVNSAPGSTFSATLHDEWQAARLDALEQALPKGEQAIVFCRFRSEVEAVAARFSGLMIHGGVPRAARGRILDDFRNRKARVLAMLKGVGGFGLNLQFCRNVAYYSNDWDLATRLQSEDRVHRLGQPLPVNIYDVVARGTLDGLMLRSAKHKASISEAVKDALTEGNITSKLAELGGDNEDF